jgi:ABC-type uncharacterized transport system substrate-binding protein
MRGHKLLQFCEQNRTHEALRVKTACVWPPSAELARTSPDVILAAAASATGPMHQATRTIPIVFANVPDPVVNGFVASLARPAGKATTRRRN